MVQAELSAAEKALQRALGLCQRARRDRDIDQIRLRRTIRDLSRAASALGVVRPTTNPYAEEEATPPVQEPPAPIPLHVPVPATVEAGE